MSDCHAQCVTHESPVNVCLLVGLVCICVCHVEPVPEGQEENMTLQRTAITAKPLDGHILSVI